MRVLLVFCLIFTIFILLGCEKESTAPTSPVVSEIGKDDPPPPTWWVEVFVSAEEWRNVPFYTEVWMYYNEDPLQTPEPDPEEWTLADHHFFEPGSYPMIVGYIPPGNYTIWCAKRSPLSMNDPSWWDAWETSTGWYQTDITLGSQGGHIGGYAVFHLL